MECGGSRPSALNELIAAFVDKIAALKPKLVTFNGASFDLPVLRYRAMLHRVSAPGLEGRPYFKRYTDDATDLCDVLSSFDSRSKMKLNDLCRALNLPGKPDGIDGSQVEQLFAEGRIAEVADYCECDVMSTYRLWLLHELFKGAISAEEHERSELALSDFIVARIQDKPHWARLRAIDHIVPMHCTGEPFYEILKAELPKKVIRSYTGTKLVFGA